MKLLTRTSFLATTAVFSQVPLIPPGAPAPTMKTLDEIHTKVADVGEKRTPISSLPFTISTSGSYFLTANLVGHQAAPFESAATSTNPHANISY